MTCNANGRVSPRRDHDCVDSVKAGAQHWPVPEPSTGQSQSPDRLTVETSPPSPPQHKPPSSNLATLEC
eukprot:CAMPEP_0174756496 /NCGR_PEP_ID=MMETSP1094-20130205/106782_2 /TAXON_ID=156173 /ORGANISM="Chrysochromulina brevifilum, Strain UTEX LB 985" /LENGTH=68 /DNA_ID=CAMNT_0015962401 /DNA_START=189 /DNA_END=396 /DNA_ORIENTATION=-